MQEKATGYIVLYDGDCRICTVLAHFVKALDVFGRILLRPIQDSGDVLGSMPDGDRLGAVHALVPDGRLTTGGDALPAIFAALSAGLPLESLLRRSRMAMRGMHRLYDVLAAVRGRLTCGIDAPVSAAGTLR